MTALLIIYTCLVLNGLYLNMVKRIVLNIDTRKIADAASFYKDVLGLDLMMDHGWIATYGVEGQKMDVQLSFASEGGAGTPTPDLSIEVGNVDEVLEKVKAAGFPVEYGPVNEPWGVRRFYTRDPFGKLINILSHY
jgi:catechol 2,3-dioxygenase-like lactoylglutathione lyase family enzyme